MAQTIGHAMLADSGPVVDSVGRRAFLGVVAASTATGVVGCSTEPGSAGKVATEPVDQTVPIEPTGSQQAGVARPAVSQANLLMLVLDLLPDADLRSLLASVGKEIIDLASGEVSEGLAPGDLTVTVGIGPSIVRSISSELPGAEELPEFQRERIAPADRGGDLMLQICAADPIVAAVAAGRLETLLTGVAQLRWRQRGFRGAIDDTGAPRNGMGFHDGLVVPRSEEEFAEGVWLGDETALAGGSLVTLRRFALDLDAFSSLSVEEQERVVGRRKRDGAPLSGGDAATEPDLHAKTPDGQYLIPVDAHVRRSNPLAAGVDLMLRRSYVIEHPEPGLLFISFQRELRTFVSTLQRMEESDALLDFATATASASFLVLPGFTDDRPLGHQLWQ